MEHEELFNLGVQVRNRTPAFNENDMRTYVEIIGEQYGLAGVRAFLDGYEFTPIQPPTTRGRPRSFNPRRT